ncbi:nitroreductase family protein [Slackia heliotrinireducens]|uniref:nitroreductase family protein n=1 Tax=Slackia heliotrinireducens TaxID=84110 RepID=UPI003314A81D
MKTMEAIEERFSCRAYSDKSIPDAVIQALQNEIQVINDDNDLNFQLYSALEDGSPAFSLSQQMFAGPVPWFAALVGPDTDLGKEQVGYFGECLVLLATQLGLGTCWVAGTFDRSAAKFEAREGDVLHDIIPLGYAAEKTPLKQRTVRAALRKRDKKPGAMLKGVNWDDAPAWIKDAVESVILGPSAVNEQPVVFEIDADGVVRATVPTIKSGLELTDLGIAKLHFQLAAGNSGIAGAWEWGDGGRFLPA